MSDDSPQPTRPEPGAPKDSRSLDGEIPDILEWKLDVIMGQLARLGGGQPAEHTPPSIGTRERLPPAETFDLEKDRIPHLPGIPEILEFKLELIIRGLGRLIRLVSNINILLGNALGVIIALLILIFLTLFAIFIQIVTITVQLILITVLLGLILFFILFVVIRIAVPFIRDNARRP